MNPTYPACYKYRVAQLLIDTILSTFGLGPHGCLWTLPKRPNISGDIVNTCILLIVLTSRANVGLLFAHLTILPLNKGPPILP